MVGDFEQDLLSHGRVQPGEFPRPDFIQLYRACGTEI